MITRQTLKCLFCCCLLHVLLLSPALAASKRIVILGDSLVAGLGLPEEDTFPFVLQAALEARGQAVTIVNAGVSGDTSAGGLSRLDWSVGDNTAAVIVELGANDMLRGIDPALTRKSLEAIVEKLKSRNLPVMLLGMLAAPGMGKVYEAKFNSIYPDIVARYGLAFYPFFLDGVAGKPEFLQPDGMHPNAKGVREILRRSLPAIEDFIGMVK